MEVYSVLSFTHKRLPIELREQLAFQDTATFLNFLQHLKHQHPSLKEIIGLCTCNRVEFYCYGTLASGALLEALAHAKNLPLALLQEKSTHYTHTEAIYHSFSVVSSLDSLVVGETQITGQFKEAYKMCLEAKLCGKHLSRLAHFAFKCAGRVRSVTAISAQVVSIASMAVKQALEVLESEDLPKKALVVGVGQMGQLVCKHLLAKGFSVLLCNRHLDNAKTFADSLNEPNIQIDGLENLKAHINAYPFCFSATHSPTPLITPDMLEPTPFRRFWFDLAVPRDIQDPKDPSVWLYSVDDLKGVVADNLEKRQKDTAKAHALIAEDTAQFLAWLQTLELDPLIKGLRDLAKQAALKELHKAIKKGYIPPELQDNVAKILHNAFNTFLHQPTAVLKKNAHKEEGDMLGESLKTLFSLGGDLFFLNAYRCEHTKGL
ncbi:glutamyl-tRNA reductase [Helicobacter ailurogastricus]|uniref:Glutamyl-tRNA reductase n=1 Tax=Helicobacter ailurogastricus TaxID=1578720 RepID=A0A0K2X7Q0_9HELI|nr:glutamyl-tRNA reductase [Helicobacter ailurogastricus]CRF41834.1 Glutamyl-tRNA reductase [Helicobacter ailurogastricus]CRF43370.1 Glutamyl-tRNA reductase [Helicobacter ailurogastricus]CRF45026.1 Glutamyl-tRNA reductase [Helicobacter ailurogastricus]GMB90328.1 Glutamyl-tRNA reductase HemA [Helicobacter ailurogastricus]GMB91979.1 Glutamyl-tRNA reductase HemA [Helicobacter ailurogastricus]